MQIIELPIQDVKPYFKNAKEHPEKQIKKIAASIKEFGFAQPIVVDKNKVIIVGHGRYLACHLLGISVIPVIILDLDEEKARAYRLADNKLNESEWDMEIVIAELKAMSLQMIDLTGFDSNLILETKEDKPDLAGIGKPKSVVGDLYQLGEHLLLCGDSQDETTYTKLLGESKARLIFTDPPYSIDYHSVDKKSQTRGGLRVQVTVMTAQGLVVRAAEFSMMTRRPRKHSYFIRKSSSNCTNFQLTMQQFIGGMHLA